MTKRIALINDLSGFGRCSLTAAISVIASMGVQPCPMPTAVLSAQTGYPSYFYDDYTDRMGEIQKEWEKMGACFDGIYMGFMSGCRQIEKAFQFLDAFHKKGENFLLVDPIMGDNGVRFEIFSARFQEEMKLLVKRADIITPNLTELCLLAGADKRFMQELAGAGRSERAGYPGNIPERAEVTKAAEQMAREVMREGPSEVVVTGIRCRVEKEGPELMGNLAVTEDSAVFSAYPFIGESYSGTGDLFASVIAGGKARGDALEDSMKLAGMMISRAVGDAVREGVPRNEGAEYEKYLAMLAKSGFVGETHGGSGKSDENFGEDFRGRILRGV